MPRRPITNAISKDSGAVSISDCKRIQDLLVGQMCGVWVIIRGQLGKDIQIKGGLRRF